MRVLQMQYAGTMVKRLANPVRAALVTAAFTFLVTFAPAALGWLAVAQSAVAEGGPIPSLSILGSAAISAGFATVAGFLNWAWRAAQEYLGRGSPPIYPSQSKAWR